jgi:hypothetical protein
MAVPILGIIFFFITLIVFIESQYKTRHRERMALIQMGKIPSDKPRGRAGLKFGLLLLALGIGVGVGNLLDMLFDSAPAFIFACTFICCGAALVFYHLMMEGKTIASVQWKDEDNDEMV